jgi:PDZ domain
MKTKNIAIMLVVALCTAVPALCADSSTHGQHPWIGVLLDTRPLPDLLVKQLGLSPGQGLRVMNVHRGSPADRAGLERDDIIIAFQGKNVTDYNSFVNEVRKAGVGTEVSLTILHSGKRKTMKLKLAPFSENGNFKYPPEPQAMQSWRPDRIFRLRPGDKEWMEMFRNDLRKAEGVPPEYEQALRSFFRERYTYHPSNGEKYTVTVEGNPNDANAAVIVRVQGPEYKTTAKQINKLPEKYRKAAEQALKDAKKASAKREEEQRSWWRRPFSWRPNFERMWPRGNAPVAPFGPNNQMFEQMRKQIRELQQRLDRLEKHQEATPQSKKLEKQASPQEHQPVRLQKKEGSRV